ncbi:MAG: xanthine dehydrogenase molybdenum-binding subunit XdhA [Desulfuromusa sp.]|nr:xanthine dehydrogenase molybdenum-binding subunit XdhA [Desulfuromusa sp.]
MSVGIAVERKDALAKVSGRAKFTEDFSVKGLKHAVYVRSTIAHGRVIKIDTQKAREIEGVRAIFTYEDVPKNLFATAGHPYAIDRAAADVADRLMLTQDIRLEGDEIAIVVADTELIAHRAAAQVEVEYEPYAALVTPEAILAPDARKIHPGGNVVGAHSYEVGGEIKTAEKEAEIVLEGEYSTAMVQHCHLENHIAYAYMEDGDNIIIVSSTQIPHISRRIVSEAINFPLGNIKVVKPFIGGGFGAKQDVIIEPIVAFLTMKMNGTPVQLNLSREETIATTRTRHPFYGKAKGGMTREGELKFLDLDVVSVTGAYASHGHSIAIAGGSKTCTMYPRAVIRYNAKTIYANMPCAGAMRAYGTPQVVFITECLMEDMARKAGIDPLDFRIKNVGLPGDTNPYNKQKILTHGLQECLIKGRELFDWDGKKAAYVDKKTGVIRSGIGVACFSYASGTYPGNVEIASCRLILNPDGSVHVHVGATEIGQGSDTAFAQMAAETTGINYADVKVISTQDTDYTPFDTGAYASRQTYVNGQAVYKAAVELREKILSYAEKVTGQAKEALTIAGDRVVYHAQPETMLITLRDLATDSYYHKNRGGQITSEVSFKTQTNAPSFGCTFVAVDVDIELCKVTIKQIINVHDSGKIINPMTAKGQVHGGMFMSIGAALFEELLVDETSGRIYNNNLLDYKFPTITDMPDLDCAFVETDEPTSSYGVKSLGEPPTISPAPAIRNAILDATGVAPDRLPMSPKNLFEQFKQAGLI